MTDTSENQDNTKQLQLTEHHHKPMFIYVTSNTFKIKWELNFFDT